MCPFDILVTHACNEYVAYQADDDLWMATFNISDLAFDNPDNNTNNPIMREIVLAVYIMDQNFTGGDDAGLNVWCIDKGITIAYKLRKKDC